MKRRTALAAMLVVAVALITVASSSAAPRPSSPFSNVRLTVPLTDTFSGVTSKTTGDSEPSIAIGNDGRMAVGGLAWIPFQVNMWMGTAGSTPSFFGAMDKSIPENGARNGLGDGDEDIDIGSTGTTHLADLDFVFNPTFNNATLGVSVTNCPKGATGPSSCKTVVLDTAGADRQWITSSGTRVYISYHDSGSSSLIHVQRSNDDGATWTKVSSPIPGQGSTTGDTTFNNTQGPLVADPKNPNVVYDIFVAGEAGIQKGSSGDFNNVYVAKSTDGGSTWVSNLVYHAPLFTPLNNIFPSLALDPVTGTLYAVWTDQHGVAVSTSSDGVKWSPAQVVSKVPTTVFPWVAAYGGKADVVYYGTTAASKDDSSAIWNTYDAQEVGGVWTELKVSKTPNHFGQICTEGTGCTDPLVNRSLLDLFEVAENPLNGKASIIYTDDTFNTWIDNGRTLPLPEIVLAQEN